MRKVFIGILLTLLLAANAWGVPIPLSGSMTYGSGIYATASWASSDTTLSWNIQQISGLWSYSYLFTVPDTSHEISHIILQVSNSFTNDDISSLLYQNGEVIPESQYEVCLLSSGSSNPGLPATLNGLKINLDPADTSFAFTLLTERSPIFGNFYAKNGEEGGTDFYAYTGTVDGFGYNLPVPDTNVVPEPGTFMLLGLGLVGIVAFRNRRR